MKYLFLLLSFNFLSLSFAQQKDLVVKYAAQTTFEEPESLGWVKRSKMPQVEINKMIKEATNEIHDYQLKIHDQQSSFEYQKKINNDQSMGRRMFFAFAPGSDWFVNLKDSTQLKEAETMGKEYLIKDSLQKFDWKISRATKKVFNIDTHKATATLDSVEYTAWYAPSIPIPQGPNAVTGLPGLIMEVDIYAPYKEGKPHHKFWVTGLETKNKVNIKKPTKGEMMSQKAFEKEIEALRNRFKEMRENRVKRD